MATRYWRAAGTSYLWPRDVHLHLLAFLQSRARYYFIRHNGSVVAMAPVVVAKPARQRHALYSCRDPFLARFVGTLSATAFSLHRRRAYSAHLRLKHSTLARQSLRSGAGRGVDLWARSGQLCTALVRLLGHKTSYDGGAIHVVDSCVDPRLHRALFLAATEVVFQMGVAHFMRGCCAASATCNDWCTSWSARSHSARRPTAMARPTY